MKRTVDLNQRIVCFSSCASAYGACKIQHAISPSVLPTFAMLDPSCDRNDLTASIAEGSEVPFGTVFGRKGAPGILILLIGSSAYQRNRSIALRKAGKVKTKTAKSPLIYLSFTLVAAQYDAQDVLIEGVVTNHVHVRHGSQALLHVVKIARHGTLPACPLWGSLSVALLPRLERRWPIAWPQRVNLAFPAGKANSLSLARCRHSLRRLESPPFRYIRGAQEAEHIPVWRP